MSLLISDKRLKLLQGDIHHISEADFINLNFCHH